MDHKNKINCSSRKRHNEKWNFTEKVDGKVRDVEGVVENAKA